MTIPGQRYLDGLVEITVEELAIELDPGGERWPTRKSLLPLEQELTEVIEGAIEDWQREKRQE